MKFFTRNKSEKKKKARGFEIVTGNELFFGNDVKMPTRKTHQSAGYDICAIGDYLVAPGQKVVVDTGLTAYMEADEFLALFARSGLSYSHDITLQNAVGVIDADYYGNQIRIMIRNEGEKPFSIKHGDRIAQGIFMKYLTVDVDEDQEQEERTGGFGSTGVQG